MPSSIPRSTAAGDRAVVLARRAARGPVRRLLAAGAALHSELERELHAQRLAGASWAAIADLLGVSKSAAHERWRYLDDLPVSIGRLDSGAAVFSSHVTGAVVGRAQVEERRRVGLVLEHHRPRTTGDTDGRFSLLPAPARLAVAS